jgi:hypothetical protein
VDTLLRLPPRDSADLIIFVEQGFVAHRVEEGLSVLLLPDEMHALREGSADDRFGIASLISGRVVASAGDPGFDPARRRRAPLLVGAPTQAVVARHEHERCTEDDAPSITGQLRPGTDSTRVETVRNGTKTVTTTTRTVKVTGADTGSTRTATPADSSGARTVTARRECRDDDDDTPYLLRVSWPAYRWTSRPPAAAHLVGAGGDSLGMLRFADLSSAVVQDVRRELPLVVARTIARGAAKAALTRAAERSAEKKNEALGEIVGVLGNLGNVLLERADTRSWHLLPGALGVARVRLPAGEHALRVELPGGRQLDFGTVRVTSRETRVLSARAW